MKLAYIIYEITLAFDSKLAPPKEYILSEYNSLIQSLLLMLPDSDGVLKVTPSDGCIETELSAVQVKKVFCGENELLRVSDSLRTVLSCGRLYTPADKKIFVTEEGECTVYYRVLPAEVDTETVGSADFPLDTRYIPLVRAWLWHRTYVYLGDFESANVYAEEYNRMLELYKAENGVSE